ncbi:MAG: 3-deoxy-7-phosphoheptulonate synthase [Lachnospiraceae bacterium]|nr:3-deoxy-7-phosphoheptulonate synthase [Lachnospiraceae bacterium]MCR4778411.1 3-deoxy-7-phosphoheptulonate synthase [Lachnospiraceae bacterium]
MNMDFKRKLAIPMEVKEMYPLTGGISKIKEERDAQIREIFEGKDDRMLLIIGPCSADNEDSVLDYMTRLAKVQEKVKDKILMVPRVYTNKPRTTGEGYKGLLHQPDPEGNPDMFKGIIATRELHMKVVEETGFTCADEMLYPESYKYIDDILSYVAIGARSVENQQHRLTASGMDVPAGMKNPTSGDLSVMMNSIYAAQHSHTFIYRGWEATSQGNPFAHAILRGYTNSKGEHHPNYHYEDIILLCDAYDKRELKNPACIIDCNHENSGKNPFEQPRIIKEVLSNCRYNKRIKDMVKGFMVESYIEDGNQKIGEGVYGKSITDACLGWEKSEKLILEMAEML